MVKRIIRLIWRYIGGQLWFLVPGLVLFIAGVAAGVMYKKALGTDLACSFLFIAGIVLIAVAVSRMGGGEAARPAAAVEEPEVKPVAGVEETDIKPVAKKKRGARHTKDDAPESVSWNI